MKKKKTSDILSISAPKPRYANNPGIRETAIKIERRDLIRWRRSEAVHVSFAIVCPGRRQFGDTEHDIDAEVAKSGDVDVLTSGPQRRAGIGGGVGAAVGRGGRRGELESVGARGDGEGVVGWRERKGWVAREASMVMERYWGLVIQSYCGVIHSAFGDTQNRELMGWESQLWREREFFHFFFYSSESEFVCYWDCED